MQKQKIKKLSAKFFLAIFIINTVFILGFTKPIRADNSSLGPHEVDAGQPLIFEWTAIYKTLSGKYQYGGYYTEIWMQDDLGNSIKIASISGTGFHSYQKIIEEAGTYTFTLIEYAPYKGYFDYNTKTYYRITGPFFIARDEALNVIINNKGYIKDLVASPNYLYQGEKASISWFVVSNVNHLYESTLSMKYEDDNTWEVITTLTGEGSKGCQSPNLEQIGNYYFKVDFYIDGVLDSSKETSITTIQEPQLLIGAADRRFPGGEGTRLGYVFQTVTTIGDLTPRIYLGLKQNISSTIVLSYDIYIDGTQIPTANFIYMYTTTYKIYFDIDELRFPIAHQIEIEITFIRNMLTNEILYDNNLITLEYLKVGRIKISACDKTLLLVHGLDGFSSQFDKFLDDANFDLNGYGRNDFKDYYAENNILKVNYYDWNNPDEEFDGYNYNIPIETIAESLKDYIIRMAIEEGKINTHLDIVAHSMGGLVVRYMMIHYYPDIRREGIIIEHIATVGTPNHGTLFADLLYTHPITSFIAAVLSIFGLPTLNTQVLQMAYPVHSSLIYGLNNDNVHDETPFSRSDPVAYPDVLWSTFRGHVPSPFSEYMIGELLYFSLLGLPGVYLFMEFYASDGVVDTDSVALNANDVDNYGIYEGIDHVPLLEKPNVLEDILNELMQE